MNEGVGLIVEVDPARAKRRLETKYLDEISDNLEDAMTKVEEALREKKPRSIGLVGNAAEVLPELAARGVKPDVVTDQTPAHDPLMYVPEMPLDEAAALRASDPQKYQSLSVDAMARHVEAMLEFQKRGAVVFDYGNNLRQRAFDAGVRNAFDFPGFVPAYIRPLFCEGKGPFRWVVLSGDPQDLYRTDEAILELFADNEHLARWIRMAQEKIKFQGLPARICWLGYGERARAGLKFNELVARRRLRADCDRARSPGCWVGGVTTARDRGDEGRERCDRRLAAAQRDAECGGRRNLGLDPSRRGGWDRLFDSRGAGDRGGWLARSGEAIGTGIDDRPWDRGHAARRCGV
jgi:urocanate hydratase